MPIGIETKQPVTPERRLEMRIRERNRRQAAFQSWTMHQDSARPTVSMTPAYLAFALSGFICGISASEVPGWPILAGAVAFGLLLLSPDYGIRPVLSFCGGLVAGLLGSYLLMLPTLPASEVTSLGSAVMLGGLASLVAVAAAAVLAHYAKVVIAPRLFEPRGPGSVNS
jgi:di/tricarboxylate transporter